MTGRLLLLVCIVFSICACSRSGNDHATSASDPTEKESTDLMGTVTRANVDLSNKYDIWIGIADPEHTKAQADGYEWRKKSESERAEIKRKLEDQVLYCGRILEINNQKYLNQRQFYSWVKDNAESYLKSLDRSFPQ